MKKLKILTTIIFVLILTWSIITRVIESFGKVPIKNILIILLTLVIVIFLLTMKVTTIIKNKKVVDHQNKKDTIN